MKAKDKIVMLDLNNVDTTSHIIISAVHSFSVGKSGTPIVSKQAFHGKRLDDRFCIILEKTYTIFFPLRIVMFYQMTKY